VFLDFAMGFSKKKFLRKRKAPTMVDASVSTEPPRTTEVATTIDDAVVGGETKSYECEESFAYGTPPTEYAEWCNTYMYRQQGYEFAEW
jgi:hypothetical protein